MFFTPDSSSPIKSKPSMVPAGLPNVNLISLGFIFTLFSLYVATIGSSCFSPQITSITLCVNSSFSGVTICRVLVPRTLPSFVTETSTVPKDFAVKVSPCIVPSSGSDTSHSVPSGISAELPVLLTPLFVRSKLLPTVR